MTDYYWEGAFTRFPQEGQLMLSPMGTLTTAPQDGQKTDAAESSTSGAGTGSSSCERRLIRHYSFLFVTCSTLLKVEVDY